MTSFKRTPHPASSFLQLGFPIYIIEIYNSITIVSASSVKTILKLLGLIGQIKSFLPLCFSAEQWSSNDTNKSVALRPRI